MTSWTASCPRDSPQDLVTLKDEKQSAAAKMFFNRDTDRGARQKNHCSGESFERPFAVGNAEAGDIMDRLVLQFDAPAAVENGIAKRNILRPVERFEKPV